MPEAHIVRTLTRRPYWIVHAMQTLTCFPVFTLEDLAPAGIASGPGVASGATIAQTLDHGVEVRATLSRATRAPGYALTLDARTHGTRQGQVFSARNLDDLLSYVWEYRMYPGQQSPIDIIAALSATHRQVAIDPARPGPTTVQLSPTAAVTLRGHDNVGRTVAELQDADKPRQAAIPDQGQGPLGTYTFKDGRSVEVVAIAAASPRARAVPRPRPAGHHVWI